MFFHVLSRSLSAPRESRARTGLASSGFTLVEMITVVAILGILATAAIPGIMQWLPNYRLKASARLMYADLQRAKLEAIKRNENIKLRLEPNSCNAEGGGYVFFFDNGAGANSGNNVQDPDEESVAQGTFQNGVCFFSASDTTAPYTASSVPRISGFTPQGLPVGAFLGVTLSHRQLSGRVFILTQTLSGGIRITDDNK